MGAQATIEALTDIDLTDLDRFAEGFPHDLFTRIRATCPVWWHPPTPHTPDGEGFWVVTRHADVLAVAADPATFSSHGVAPAAPGGTLIEDLPRPVTDGLLNMQDDPHHQEVRRLVSPAVSPRALAEIETELRGRAARVVADALAKGDCDFLVDVAAELPLQAIARLLGVPQGDRHQLFEWATKGLDYADRELGESNATTRDASAAMAAYAAALLVQRRASPADDMLSALVRGATGETEQAKTEQALFFSLLMAAGSDTTRNSIAIGLAALLETPGAWARLQADRDRDGKLLKPAVEEMLRWATPAPYNRRTATRDAVIGGTPVAAGDKVTLWWASANRDEAVFDDPFRFDIGRDPNPHVAFGHSAHFCLGATLARMEMRVLFDALLGAVAEPELTGPIEWTRSNKHTGVRHLPVQLRPAAARG